MPRIISNINESWEQEGEKNWNRFRIVKNSDVLQSKHLSFRLIFLKTELRGLSPNERTVPTERSPFVGEVSAKFADRGCQAVSVTDPYGRILGFLDRDRYFFFQVAPQLYSRGWVDPVPDPLLFRRLDLQPGTLNIRPQRRSSGWHLLRGLSSRANYTDRAITFCRRS
jgi:hypothetical protein